MVIKIVLLCSVAACALAAPSPTGVVPLEKQQPTVIPILSQSEELEANGTYKFSYETANGIKREETSYDKILPKAEGRSRSGSSESSESGSDESNEIHVQQGSYSYTAPDGTLITVRYIADENGFRVFGDHLPKAPALTQQIQARANSKSGRKLESDNAESGSAPAVATEEKNAKDKPDESPVKLESRIGSDASAAEATTAAAAPEKSATEALVAKEAVPTTEPAVKTEYNTKSAPEQSTTEYASTVAAEAASTEASTSPASEASTTESASSTESASTTVAESAKPEDAPASATEQSTTEGVSTVAAESSGEVGSTVAPEAASTEAQSSPEMTTTDASSPTTAT